MVDSRNEPCEIAIGRLTGAVDPSPIAIQIRRGRRTMRVELTPANFAACVTGALVPAVITREDPENG